MLGYHGALYQRCLGWTDAALRMMQALYIGGLVSRLPRSARRAPDMGSWLSALKTKTPDRPLYFSDGIWPSPVIVCPLPDAHSVWRSVELGKKSAHRIEEVPVHPLAPQPRRLTELAEERREQVAAPRGDRRGAHAAQSPSLSAVGGGQGQIQPGRGDGSSAVGAGAVDVGGGQPVACRAAAEGYWVVMKGRTPWIYSTL